MSGEEDKIQYLMRFGYGREEAVRIGARVSDLANQGYDLNTALRHVTRGKDLPSVPDGNRSIAQLQDVLRERAGAIIDANVPEPDTTFRGAFDEALRDMEARDSRPDNVARQLKENPQLLADIEAKLGPDRPFAFVGYGDHALALSFNDTNGNRQILRITDKPTQALDSSIVLKPHAEAVVGKIRLQITEPVAILGSYGELKGGEIKAITDNTDAHIWREGNYSVDPHPNNYGITRDGRVVVPDLESVRTIESQRAAMARGEMLDLKAVEHQMDWVAVRAAGLLTELPAAPTADTAGVRTDLLDAFPSETVAKPGVVDAAAAQREAQMAAQRRALELVKNNGMDPIAAVQVAQQEAAEGKILVEPRAEAPAVRKTLEQSARVQMQQQQQQGGQLAMGTGERDALVTKQIEQQQALRAAAQQRVATQPWVTGIESFDERTSNMPRRVFSQIYIEPGMDTDALVRDLQAAGLEARITETSFGAAPGEKVPVIRVDAGEGQANLKKLQRLGVNTDVILPPESVLAQREATIRTASLAAETPVLTANDVRVPVIDAPASFAPEMRREGMQAAAGNDNPAKIDRTSPGEQINPLVQEQFLLQQQQQQGQQTALGERRSPYSLGALIRGDGVAAADAVRLPELGADQFDRMTVPDGRGGFKIERERRDEPLPASVRDKGGDAPPAAETRPATPKSRAHILAAAAATSPAAAAELDRLFERDAARTAPEAAQPEVPQGPNARVGRVGGSVAGAAGVGMGVVGLTEKFGSNGTYAADIKINRTTANVGVAADVSGIGAGVLEVAVGAGKIRGLGVAGAALGVVSGGAETVIAFEAHDGRRAARAMGGTVGGLAGGLAGAAGGAQAGAAAGAAIGVWFGGVGAVPGAAIGGVVGGLIGGTVGALGGGWAGGKAAEAAGGDALQDYLNTNPEFKGRGGAIRMMAELGKLTEAATKGGWGRYVGNGDRNVTAQELRAEITENRITVAEIDKNQDGHFSGSEVSDALKAHGANRRPATPGPTTPAAPAAPRDWRAEQARAAVERQAQAGAAASTPVNREFTGRAGAQHLNEELKDLEQAATRGGWGKFLGNGDSQVTVGELRQAMQKYDIKISEIDRNVDGQISGREMNDALKAHGVNKQPVRDGSKTR